MPCNHRQENWLEREGRQRQKGFLRGFRPRKKPPRLSLVSVAQLVELALGSGMVAGSNPV